MKRVHIELVGGKFLDREIEIEIESGVNDKERGRVLEREKGR